LYWMRGSASSWRCLTSSQNLKGAKGIENPGRRRGSLVTWGPRENPQSVLFTTGNKPWKGFQGRYGRLGGPGEGIGKSKEKAKMAGKKKKFMKKASAWMKLNAGTTLVTRFLERIVSSGEQNLKN